MERTCRHRSRRIDIRHATSDVIVKKIPAPVQHLGWYPPVFGMVALKMSHPSQLCDLKHTLHTLQEQSTVLPRVSTTSHWLWPEAPLTVLYREEGSCKAERASPSTTQRRSGVFPKAEASMKKYSQTPDLSHVLQEHQSPSNGILLLRPGLSAGAMSINPRRADLEPS